METKLHPTLDRVAIKREEVPTISKGGIILPGNEKRQSNYGKVLAIGPGGFNIDGSRKTIGVKVGDKVFFTNDYYMTDAGNDTVIVDEEGIVAIVKD